MLDKGEGKDGRTRRRRWRRRKSCINRACQEGDKKREVRSISISFSRFMDSMCYNCGIFVRFLNLFCLLSPNKHLRHDALRGGVLRMRGEERRGMEGNEEV